MSSKEDEVAPPTSFSFDASNITLGPSIPISVDADLRKASRAAEEVHSELERSEFMKSGRLLSTKRLSLMRSVGRAAAAAQGAFGTEVNGSEDSRGNEKEHRLSAATAAARAEVAASDGDKDLALLNQIRNAAQQAVVAQRRSSSMNVGQLSRGKTTALPVDMDNAEANLRLNSKTQGLGTCKRNEAIRREEARETKTNRNSTLSVISNIRQA